MVTLNLPEPTVMIPYNVWAKLQHWVQKGGSHECSGMGKVVTENGVVRVVDAWMVKQTNSGAETEMDADALGKLYYQQRNTPGAWQFWWHSHASMDVFWSGTDRDQIGKLAANGMCVAVVLNTRGQSKCCVAINEPLPMHMDDLDITIGDGITNDQRASWDKEYSDNVEAKAFSYNTGRAFADDEYDPYWWKDDKYYQEYSRGRSARVTDAFGKGNPKSELDIQRGEIVDRLAEINKHIQALNWTLSAKKNVTLTKFVVETVCNITWSKDLTLDTEVTGFDGKPTDYTIEDVMVDTLTALEEEQKELLKGLTNASSGKDRTN